MAEAQLGVCGVCACVCVCVYEQGESIVLIRDRVAPRVCTRGGTGNTLEVTTCTYSSYYMCVCRSENERERERERERKRDV